MIEIVAATAFSLLCLVVVGIALWTDEEAGQ